MLQLVDNPLSEFEAMVITDRVKKKLFARNFAMGVPSVRALRAAGFDRPNTAMATKLLGDPEVLEAIEKVYSDLRHPVYQSRESIISKLMEDREFAYNQENAPAAIAATVALAKVLGLMDKVGDTKMPTKISVEWGEANSEVIYEKSNPLLYNAIVDTVGAK